MRKLISLLLTAVLLFAACGKAGKPYLEAIEMNEIQNKQKEIYMQDIKVLEERNENLLKALNETPRPVLGAEPKPESHTVKKVILTTIGVAAAALLVYCVGIFVGMQNGNEYCQNVAHKINLGGIWLCDKVAYYAMRLAGLSPESIKRGMDTMLLPEDDVYLSRVEAGQAMNEIWLRRQYHTPTHDDSRTPNGVDEDFGTLRVGLHLPQDGQGNTGVMRCMNRQRNSAAWVVQDVTLAAAAERDNDALRKNANAHMAEEIKHLDQTVVAQQEQLEAMRTENLKLKTYIDKHGGSPVLHSLNSKMEASISREKQLEHLNRGLSQGHYRGYTEHKMKTQAEINNAYKAGIEQGTAQGIEKGMEMQLDKNQLKLLGIGRKQEAARRKALLTDTWGQTDTDTKMEANTGTDPVQFSSPKRDQRIYKRGFVEAWHIGFVFGRSCEKDFMQGQEAEAWNLYGAKSGLLDYKVATALYNWVNPHE